MQKDILTTWRHKHFRWLKLRQRYIFKIAGDF